VGPRAGLDDVEKRTFLTQLGIVDKSLVDRLMIFNIGSISNDYVPVKRL
jgi:hypothetical protein